MSKDTQQDDGEPGRPGAAVLPGLPRGLRLPELPGALCKGQDPEAWFPASKGWPGLREAAAGKARCYPCPARVPCLRWALRVPETEGIWGGTTPDERTRMRRAAQLSRDAASA
jgi:WhiB family redox-sensing transcriptional regulator